MSHVFKNSRYRDDYQYLIKMIVIGDTGVGKSCLLTRFVDKVFIEDYVGTIGIDFKIKPIEIDEKNVKLQIWDTAGQERFKTITTSYYRGCHCALFVFDITDRKSFDSITKWYSEVKVHANPEIQCLLVGNKSDKDDYRVVSIDEAKNLAESLNMEYIEASAKDNDVGYVFDALVRKTLYRLIKVSVKQGGDEDKEQLTLIRRQVKKERCC